MFKLSHFSWIVISGLIWFAVGVYLLPLGLSLILAASKNPSIDAHYPILDSLTLYASDAQGAATILIAICMLVGYFKARFVFSKSVHRVVQRILKLPNPTSFDQVYSKAYYILIGSMVLLGMGMKFFGVVSDVRGAIDVAVGCALINGSLMYFRTAFEVRKRVHV